MGIFNFDGTGGQKEPVSAFGPVPEGSVVFVRIELQTPREEQADPSDPLVQVTSGGMRQLPIRCFVTQGTYAGVRFWNNLALPVAFQPKTITPGQKMAADIAERMMKAMLQASGRKNMSIASWKDFDGLEVPVRVKIGDRPRQGNKEGHLFWNNEIAKVIIPRDPEWTTMENIGEIIKEDGPVESPRYHTRRGVSDAEQRGPIYRATNSGAYSRRDRDDPPELPDVDIPSASLDDLPF